MSAQNIHNSNYVNTYIDRLQQRELGYEKKPVIGNGNFAVTAESGLFCYAIKADGAADVVISAVIDQNGTAYSLPGNITILAGDVLLLACRSFTHVSGQYIAYLAQINTP